MRKKTGKRLIAGMLINVIAIELMMPIASFALTAGPTQPEYASFEPLATSQMVNEFTGGFTYNIPLMEVPSPGGLNYPITLAYHSGANLEEEASWVGYGWSLNIGSINRSLRGLPDDYNGSEIKRFNFQKPTISIGVGGGTGYKVLSYTAGVSSNLRYNNHTGYSSSVALGFGGGFSHLSANIGITIDDKGSGSISGSAGLGGNTNDFFAPNNENQARLSDTDSEGNRGRLHPSVAASASFILGNNRYPVSNSPGFDAYCLDFSVSVEATLIPASPIVNGLSPTITGTYTKYTPRGYTKDTAFGTMYDANSLQQSMRDYSVENDQPFERRNKFLGIPSAQSDYFSVAAEGLGGTMKYYPYKTRTFGPKLRVNPTVFGAGGLGPNTVSTPGVGLMATFGVSNLTISNPNTSQQSTNEGTFRFIGDMGGNAQYADKHGKINTPYTSVNNQSEGIGAANFVQYKTINEALTHPSIARFVAPNGVRDAIGEISITKPEGSRYVYGLPVFSRYERNLTYGALDVNKSTPIRDESIYYDFHKNRVPQNYDGVVVGEDKSQPYVSSWLLTEIYSEDYVDRTDDGPTPDDYGEYVKFTYVRTAGSNDKWEDNKSWYKWRSPYTGYRFDRGQIWDADDDKASVMYGEKEIYYIESIETKSHCAYFVMNKPGEATVPPSPTIPHEIGKGTGTERYDGYESYHRENTPQNIEEIDLNEQISGGSDINWGRMMTSYDGNWSPEFSGKSTTFTSTNGSVQAMSEDYYNSNVIENKVRKLEKVILCVKKTDGSISEVKRAMFEHDYSIMEHGGGYWLQTEDENGNPLPEPIRRYAASSLNSAFGIDRLQNNVHSDDKDSFYCEFSYGKLTLKKVWFEYAGKRPVLVSPYVFAYSHPQQGAGDGYPDQVYDFLVVSDNQTPRYSAVDIDRWGRYAPHFAADRGYSFPYVDQSRNHDAGAWNLKSIILPSGAQIVVDYEDGDYSYVQDRQALVMARLSAKPMKISTGPQQALRCFLDLSTVGANTNAEKSLLVEKIKRQYIVAREKMYFRFLFPFKVCAAPSGYPKSGPYANINGYCDVIGVGISPGGGVYIDFRHDDKYSPIGIAQSYAANTRVLNTPCDQWSKIDGEFNFLKEAFWRNIIRSYSFATSALTEYEDFASRALAGSPLPEHSYLRIPVLSGKKGGAPRVKHLLTIDRGIGSEEDGSAVNGVRYTYSTIDANGNTISSGVATNEPAVGRDENALVRYLQDRHPLAWNEFAALAERQGEGPIGESFLPAPSVGYSVVRITPLRHLGSNERSGGFTEKKFYTYKDFPITAEATPLRSKALIPMVLQFSAPVFGAYFSHFEASQKYAIIDNGMHGQIRSVEIYRSQGDSGAMVMESSQKYDYMPIGEQVYKVDFQNEVCDRGYLGASIEHIQEKKNISEIGGKLSLRFDMGITSFFTPYFSAQPFIHNNSNTLDIEVATTYSYFPAILTSVSTYKQGKVSTKRNIAFDIYTGVPLVTSITDEYNNEVSTITIPASHIYPLMGQKRDSPNYQENQHSLFEQAGQIVLLKPASALLSTTNTASWISEETEVISAVASTYVQFPNIPPRWRRQANYLYVKERRANDDVRSDGVFSNMPWFNYQTITSNPPSWVRQEMITLYTEDGLACEQQDALGRYSAVRFAHPPTDDSPGMLPAITVSNARYSDTYFNSFEDDADADATSSHTGKKSFKVTITKPLNCDLGNIATDNPDSVLVEYWELMPDKGVVPQTKVQWSSTDVTPTVVARSGKWGLFRAILTGGNGAMFSILAREPSTETFIDDVKIQPLHSVATCYVYDNKLLKPVAILDQHHFALIYQYNGEGKLIRTMKETERGLKTVSDVHSHTPQSFFYGQHTLERKPPAKKNKAFYRRDEKAKEDFASPRNSNETDNSRQDATMKRELLKLDLSGKGSSMKIFDKEIIEVPLIHKDSTR